MRSGLLLLWAISGGAIATWVMIHIWLPDPPPDIWGRFFSILVLGIIGGLVGGGLLNGSLQSPDPMPGIVGALGAGLILSGAAGLLTGAARKAGR